MADPVLGLELVFIQAIIGGGIWGIPGVLHAKYMRKERIRVAKLAVTFATAIAVVLVSHFGGLPIPQAAYWVEALGFSALVGKWWGELEAKLGTKAPEITPPAPPG